MKKTLILFWIAVMAISVKGQSISVPDTRDVVNAPSDFSQEVKFEFKRRVPLGIPGAGNYSTMMTLAPWYDASGDKNHQLNFNDGGLFYRSGLFGASWDNWKKIVMSDVHENTILKGVLRINTSSDSPIVLNSTDNSWLYTEYSWSGTRKAWFGISSANNFQIQKENGGNIVFDGANVGVGTTIPEAKFQVFQSSNTDWAVQIHNSGGDGRGLKVKSASSNDNPVFLAANNYDVTRFQVNSNGETYINGALAIGTTKRNGYKLAVEGVIGAREIVVNTDTWSDFVFSPDYKLKSLNEVESFIEENNHLPDIPSEKEVKENGISVGEMNAKLLQKIEELTLYVIEQQKQIEKQNKKIESLENKIINSK